MPPFIQLKMFLPLVLVLFRWRSLFLLGRVAAPAFRPGLGSVVEECAVAATVVAARGAGFLTSVPFRILGRVVGTFPRVPFVEEFAPRVTFRDLPRPAAWWVWITGGELWDFSGYTLEAPREVRHQRDFSGPRDFSALQDRFESRLVLWVVLGFCVVRVLWGLWHEYLKPVPGATWSFWEDPPSELPGSVDLHTSPSFALVSPEHAEVRSCGRYVPITSAVSVQRLRQRARWVRALEQLLGGRAGVVATFVRGRWTPDLPSDARSDVLNYALGGIENGARCLGGGITTIWDGNTPARHIYLVLDVGGSVQLVYPELLGLLRQYSLFRERDGALLSALRSRAIQWCKGRSFRAWVADMAVAGAVCLAMVPSTHERSAIAHVHRAAGLSPDHRPAF